MDDLRRSPPPFPPLAVRERGNFISVREARSQSGGWGTLNRPKPIEMPRLGQQTLHTRLGFEATPSSEVWGFQAPYPLQLQVNRRSEDRMANCVAVALLDGGNRHVAPLVATARGIGAPVTVPAGEYKIIASLGIAEEVTVELEVNVAPPLSLAGRLLQVAGGAGALLSSTRRGLTGVAMAAGGGRGLLGVVGRRLIAAAPMAAAGQLVLRAPLLAGRAVQGMTAFGRLDLGSITLLRGTALAAAGGRAPLRPIVWVNDPESFWRVRRNGAVLEINRAYFATDPALQRQQLLEAGL